MANPCIIDDTSNRALSGGETSHRVEGVTLLKNPIIGEVLGVKVKRLSLDHLTASDARQRTPDLATLNRDG